MYYSEIKKWGSVGSFMSYKHIKLELRVFIIGYSILSLCKLQMHVKEISTICSPMIGYLFDTFL